MLGKNINAGLFPGTAIVRKSAFLSKAIFLIPKNFY